MVVTVVVTVVMVVTVAVAAPSYVLWRWWIRGQVLVHVCMVVSICWWAWRRVVLPVVVVTVVASHHC